MGVQIHYPVANSFLFQKYVYGLFPTMWTRFEAGIVTACLPVDADGGDVTRL